MTRTDYRLIAEVLRITKPSVRNATVGEQRAWGNVVRAFTESLAKESGKFDEVRFHKACGFSAEVL